MHLVYLNYRVYIYRNIYISKVVLITMNIENLFSCWADSLLIKVHREVSIVVLDFKFDPKILSCGKTVTPQLSIWKVLEI